MVGPGRSTTKCVSGASPAPAHAHAAALGRDRVHDPPEPEVQAAEPARLGSEVVRDETLGRDRDQPEPALAAAGGDFLRDVLIAGDAPEVAASDARTEAGRARPQRGGPVDHGIAVWGNLALD